MPVAVSELSQAGRAAVIKTLSFGTHEETVSDAPTLMKPSVPGDRNQASVTRVQNAKELIGSCERELEQKPAPTAQRAGRLHFEIARLQDSSLGDLTSAAEHYQSAHRLLPDHLPSILGARRALLQAGQFAAALPLFDAELRATSNAAKKALVSLEKARILDEKLGLKREARDAYEAALELDESNPSALRAVERAELAAKAWDALEKTYQRAAQVLTSDGRASRCGAVRARAPVRGSQARQSHGDGAVSGGVRGRSGRALCHFGSQAAAHGAPAPPRSDHVLLEREAVLSADPGVRALSLYRVARLYADRIGNLESAADALERALSHVTDEPMILEELARVYELSRRHADLVRILELIAGRLEASTERVGIYHRLAQIYEDKLADEPRAVQWYERALAAERGYVPAIQALAKLYTRSKQWQELVRVHTGEAEATNDPARRAAAYSRIAQICESELKQVDQAVQHHARALGVLPGYAPSFKAVDTSLHAGPALPGTGRAVRTCGGRRRGRRDQDHVPVQGRALVRGRARGARAGADCVPPDFGRRPAAPGRDPRVAASGRARWPVQGSGAGARTRGPKKCQTNAKDWRFCIARAKCPRSNSATMTPRSRCFARSTISIARTRPHWPVLAACTTRPAATKICSRRIRPNCEFPERVHSLRRSCSRWASCTKSASGAMKMRSSLIARRSRWIHSISKRCTRSAAS